jgi:CheY-like chemotaxis protein
VLYVEDNQSNVRLVELIMEFRPQWTLTIAEGGVRALELAISTRYDLILLDQGLPDLGGLAVLRELRNRDDRKDVPIVMVTADAAPGQHRRALDAGATGYLVKPFAVEELLEILDAHSPKIAPETTQSAASM